MLWVKPKPSALAGQKAPWPTSIGKMLWDFYVPSSDSRLSILGLTCSEPILHDHPFRTFSSRQESRTQRPAASCFRFIALCRSFVCRVCEEATACEIKGIFGRRRRKSRRVSCRLNYLPSTCLLGSGSSQCPGQGISGATKIQDSPKVLRYVQIFG